MMFNIFCKIDEIVKKYTESYALSNRAPDLKVVLTALVTDKEKEFILNDIDYTLRDLVDFSHTYENGKLQIIFN